MTWREQLRPASFRGQPFFVSQAEFAGGRRVTEHEYPLRDRPFVEDLGRRARRFTIEGYVIGPDYMTARDRLIEALEQPGPGSLVHPYYGSLTMALGSGGFKVSETGDKGGFAKFSIPLIEAGENRLPATETNTAAMTGLAADDAKATTETAFAEKFDVNGQPQFVANASAVIVVSVSAEIEIVADRLVSEGGGTADFRRAISELGTAATGLVRDATALASRVSEVIDSLTATATNTLAVIRAHERLAAFGASLVTVPTTTEARRAEAANQAALVALVRQQAVIAAARASAQVELASRNEATALRLDISARLDVEVRAAGDAGDDLTFNALRALRAAVVRDLARRGGQAPALISITAIATLPALVLAHRLYGADPSRVIAGAEDIVARNRIRHPDFVAGGTELEVLGSV